MWGVGEDQPQLLTAAQVAEKLGYTEQWVRRLVSRGEIPHLHLPTGGLRFLHHEIAQWVETTRENQESG